jgi:putative PEP-CTERM system histidine kinase
MQGVELTDLGFAACAATFAVLAVALRPGTVASAAPRIPLRLAALATVVWTIVAWLADRSGSFASTWAQLLSIALIGIWLWQLENLARWQGQPRWLSQLLRWSGLIATPVLGMWMLLASRVDPLPPPSLATLSIVGIALSALGLITIEQLYRNSQLEAVVAMRWLGLGIGGLLVAELVVFSQTMLLGQLPMVAWTMRGLIFALCAFAIFQGARSMPDWSFGLSVSRHVVFYASSFLLIGSYLVVMSLVGWLLLKYSGGWQPLAQAAFAILAALLLGLSLYSGGLLRRLKVLISAHFYPQRYDYRSEWLRFTRTLSEVAEGETVRQRAIRALAQIISSPSGSLWRRKPDGTQFEFTTRWPVDHEPGKSIPASDPLPAFLSRMAWLIDLPELRRKPELYGGLEVDSKQLGAADNALLVPLLHRDQLYGWIVLERPSPLREMNFEDRDLLKTAGRHVAAHLAQLDADAHLAEAHQFETYNRMTAFVMHDLKNIAAQLRLISQNAGRHRGNPEFVDDALRTVDSAANRMTKLIHQLASGEEGGTMQTVDLATCAERAVRRCGGNSPVPLVVAQARPVVFADTERLTTVIEHAVRNAQDATDARGEIRIEVGQRGRRPLLSVMDTGAGMDPTFVRDRLFRPFDTTKGARGMGIGAFQMREYVRSLGGEVEVESEPGRGTTIHFLFSEQPVNAGQQLAG